MVNKPKIKRLFWDIEVSPNVVYSWKTGYNLSISVENIIQERAIICIGYKWQGEPVKCLSWKAGDDKELLEKFVPILESADEVVAHWGDGFDLPWLRGRAAKHGIPVDPNIKTIDTCKQARKTLYLNSNKLDYVAEFLGLGQKIDTDFKLWKDVVTGSKKALARMIEYCKMDVILLEKVYLRLEGYNKPKTHVGVLLGGTKADCPQCGSSKVQKRGYRVSAAGVRSQIMSCSECGRNYTSAIKVETGKAANSGNAKPRVRANAKRESTASS